MSYCPLYAPAKTVPYLCQGVLGWHKQNKAVFSPMGQEQRNGSWLIKSSEIPEIAVLPKGKLHIGVVALSLSSRYYSGEAPKG
jgi:hypothetical protein